MSSEEHKRMVKIKMKTKSFNKQSLGADGGRPGPSVERFSIIFASALVALALAAAVICVGLGSPTTAIAIGTTSVIGILRVSLKK
jgi:hypothetical protein